MHACMIACGRLVFGVLLHAVCTQFSKRFTIQAAHCKQGMRSWMQTTSSKQLPPGMDRWGGAIGNVEDAKVTLATITRAIDDAVYLDEDSFNQMVPIMQYQRSLQVGNVMYLCTCA